MGAGHEDFQSRQAVSYSRLNPEPPEYDVGIVTTESECLTRNSGFFITTGFSN